MAVRKVAVLGHPVLRQQAQPIPKKDIRSPSIQNLIRDMIDTMFEYDGRGLAAPQIHESLQCVVMLWDFEPNKSPSILCLINPSLKILTTETSSYWEGCLSVPGLKGKVNRPNKVSVDALDPEGNPLELTLQGFAATVVQHECDHLLGKLYIDRMADLSFLAFVREYQKYFAPQEKRDSTHESA